MKILIPFLIVATIVIVTFLLFQGFETVSVEYLESVRNYPTTFALASFAILVSDIFLPIPSSIVMYFNGAVLGVFNGFWISFISVNLSSVIGYFVGKYTAFALKSEAEETSKKLLRKYGHFAVIITRGVPILSESVCFVCGYKLYDFKTYFLLNFFGYLPICLIYAYFGSISQNQNLFFLSFAGSILVSALFWLFGRRLFRV